MPTLHLTNKKVNSLNNELSGISCDNKEQTSCEWYLLSGSLSERVAASPKDIEKRLIHRTQPKIIFKRS